MTDKAALFKFWKLAPRFSWICCPSGVDRSRGNPLESSTDNTAGSPTLMGTANTGAALPGGMVASGGLFGVVGVAPPSSSCSTIEEREGAGSWMLD